MLGLIRRLSVSVPWNALLKSFIRPHLDYETSSWPHLDILCDKLNNENFQNKMEKVQYRACLAITDGIQGTSGVVINGLIWDTFIRSQARSKHSFP